MSSQAVAADNSLQDVHVLHVDDEPNFAEMVGTFLEREDDRLTIDTATSVSAGLDCLSGADYDCIVSDYDMPGQNGIEFLEAVRAEHPRLPFILYTGKGSEEVASDAISAGVTDYLQKASGTEQYALLANKIRNAARRATAEHDRDRHLQAIETAQEGISILDEDGDFIYVNQAYADLFGYDPDEMVGEHWELIYPEDGIEFARTEILPTVDQDGYWHGETTGLRADGTTFPEDHIVTKTADDNLICTVRDVSDRRNRNAELRMKTRAMEAAPIGISITDPSQEDNPLIYVNKAFETLTGYTGDEVSGRNCRFLQGDDTDPEAVAAMRKAVDANESVAVDLRNYRKDGSPFWNRVTIAPVTDENGTVTNYVGFQQDITDRKEQELEHERVVELLGHTERIADVGGWEIDTETQDVFWSDHLFEILGLTDDGEPPLEDALDVYVEEDRPRVERAVEDALTAGEPFDLEARFRRPDGGIRWLTIQGEPTIEDGTVVTLRGAVQDITERKERKRELEQIEARFRALAENFPNGGVHYFDEDLRYQYVAGAGFDPLDLSPADLEGNTIYDVDSFSVEIVETLESLMESTLAGNTEFDEGTYDGREYELRSVPIRDADGDIGGGFFITQDVTDRHRREGELKRQNEQLEEFASIVSHDLHSPLNVAQGRLELVQEECDSEHLDRIDDALERSQTLIDDLLTLAREGKKVSAVETVALGRLAENCWHGVEVTGATLSVTADRSIRADPSRLQQLLENLYRNAGEHGGDDVTVTVGDLPDGFYIEDDGCGIPENMWADVFDAGYSTVDGGTGFGLSIVKQIVDAHGWTIRLTESSAGGARFEITGVTFGR